MQSSNWKLTTVLVALCVATLLAPALWLRGDLGHVMLTMLVATTVWPLSGSLWGLGRWLASRSDVPRKRRVDLELAAFFKPIFLLASCFLGSWVVGAGLHTYDIHAAKRWCEGHIESIEHFHAENGRYPSNLAEVADIASGPVLVRDGSAEIFSRDDGYSFDIVVDLLNGRHWDSTRRCWDN